MKNLFKILFLFLAINAIAQQEVNTSFATQMNNMFSPLDKNRVPHGILLDFAMEFTNVPAFNGTLSDSTYVNPKVLKEIYHTLLMGRIRNVTSGLISPQDFENNWFNQRSEDHIALSGIYFKYARFINNATTTGKLTYAGGKFYDRFVNGVWQNPYQEMQTFAMTTPIEVYSGLQLKVKLPQNIFYSNFANEVLRIDVDFADGIGYRQLYYNQLVNVNYSQEGNKIWKYKLTLNNGQILLTQSKIKILKGLRVTNTNSNNIDYRSGAGVPWNNCNPALTDVYRLDIESAGTFNGQKGKARIFIDDAGNDCKITKPLIVVEGFDFTTLLSPESKFSTEDYIKFTKSIYDSNSNIGGLISGNSWTSFGDQQYDIIYVNWDNGLDFIERNALVVEEVIKWVNLVKEGNEKLVVMGQSMGGVVSRYAIRDMEQRNLTHNVRLFVSQDSPQEGANVPLSIQYLYRNLRNQVVQANLYNFVIPIFASIQPIENLFSLLDQPATRQMLKNRITSNYVLENSLHNSFYNNLRAKGFPQQGGIRNVAIGNGSECGTIQNISAGDVLITANAQAKLGFISDILSIGILPVFGVISGMLVDPDFFKVGLLSLLPGNSKFNAFLEDRLLYPVGGFKIHDFSLSYTKKILWIFPVTTSIINKQLHQPSGINLHYDNYGGGFIDIAGYTGNSGGSGSSSIPWIYSSGYSYAIRDKFNLVPTPSALAINATTDAQYKTAYVGGQLVSPFINFATAYKNPTNPNNNNEKHLEFNARNGDWLAAELGNPTPTPYTTNCSFLCNSQPIIGLETLCNSGVYSAPAGATSYQWQVLSGNNLVILSNATSQNATLTAIPSNGFGNVTIRVFLSGISTTNGNLQNCGFLDKSIWVGFPQFNEFTFGNGLSQNVCIAPVDCLTPSLPSTEIYASFSGLSISELNNNSNWQWERNNNLIMLNSVRNRTTVCPLEIGNSGFKVRVRNACGWSEWVDFPSFEITLCANNNRLSSTVYAIYPNPSNDNINVDLRNNEFKPIAENNVKGELFDLFGQSKGITNIINNKANISVQNLNKGVYVLKIYFDDKVESHQVIVQ
jgi:hypothetical protein